MQLTKMQGLAGGSRAPLGLLLICLYLPGLFARSIGEPEEKISLHSGKPSFTSLFNSGQPQPKPGPVNNELPRVLPSLNEFLQDDAPPEEGSEMPSQPSFWEGPPMDAWLSEDPQQGMEATAEDHLEQALPEALPYLSRGSPMASSAYEAFRPEDLEPAQQPGSNLRTEAEAFAQHPFLYLIHRLLPGLPWGILSPSASWGAGGAGTGWGRRPMPYPSGIWDNNRQLSGTNLGANGRYAVGTWGTNGQYPAGNWGANGWYPTGSWRPNGPYPAGSWGANCRYPAGSWGTNCQNQIPNRVRPPGRNKFPPRVRPPGRNKFPPRVRPPGRNQVPPGVSPPGSSGRPSNFSLE